MIRIHPRFTAVAAWAIERIGPVHLRALADRIAEGGPPAGIVRAVPIPGFAEVAQRILDEQLGLGIPGDAAAIYLHGVAAGYERHRTATRVESVWTGPATNAVPVRSTAQVLIDVAGEARHELILMTYSATPYEPLLDALAQAVARGASVMVVVETLRGAGSALDGTEPAAAFASLNGVQLWHWPVEERSERGAKMHAKLAVADRRILLVSSANLTQSGVSKNIEAGVLIRGGTAPQRAAEHVAELRARGVLRRLR